MIGHQGDGGIETESDLAAGSLVDEVNRHRLRATNAARQFPVRATHALAQCQREPDSGL